MIKTGIRRKQLQNALKETTAYCKLKKEALDCNMGRTRFERSNGTVVRQTTE